MKHAIMRTALIDSTISVIAEDGFDKATTKAIAAAAGLNEAYIYRLFDGKEDLFNQAFWDCNQRLMHQCIQSLRENDYLLPDLQSINRAAFMQSWAFVLNDGTRCLFYVRYYYSPYFQKYVQEEYQRSLRRSAEEVRRFFPEGVDVADLLHHTLDVALHFAVKVIYGEEKADEHLAERVYQLSKGRLDAYKNDSA